MPPIEICALIYFWVKEFQIALIVTVDSMGGNMNIHIAGAITGVLVPIAATSAFAQATASAAASCPKRFADAEPRGQQNWITMEDYPQRALREGRQGKVRFRVDVTVAGRAEYVEILESSDSDLAAATTRVLTRRARFTPAVRECQPVPGEYEGALTWSLPE